MISCIPSNLIIHLLEKYHQHNGVFSKKVATHPKTEYSKPKPKPKPNRWSKCFKEARKLVRKLGQFKKLKCREGSQLCKLSQICYPFFVEF